MKLNCIATDDEPLALELICTYIRQTPFLNLIGGFSSGIEALNSLHQNQIDLIFLDIRMPGLSGMELAKIVSNSQQEITPRIIFTTAFNQYALEGYQVDALDYLLKPFSYVDFSKAASKALSYFELIRKPRVVEGTTIKTSIVHPEDDYLFLKVEYQLVKVDLKEILYIEGLGDYVKVHLIGQEKAILSLTSLKALEEKIPNKRFMRVHRSFIVALDKINAITKNSVQIGKTIINVTDQYKEPFSKFLKRWV